MEGVGGILQRAIRKSQLYERMVLRSVERFYRQVWGEIDESVQFIGVRGKEVIVFCQNACASVDLHLKKDQLLSFLSDSGFEDIKGIRIRTGAKRGRKKESH